MKLEEKNIQFVLDGIKIDGDTNLLPVPFEYNYIEAQQISEKLSNWNMESDLKYLVPKSKYGFRNASLLDPIDLILYTTFIFQEIQKVNINKSFIYSNKFEIDKKNKRFLHSDFQGFIDKSLELG